MLNLKVYPTAIAGLALGMMGIASFWGMSIQSPHSADFVLVSWTSLVVLLLIPLIMKFFRYPSILQADLKCPTVGSVVPTLAMAMMIVSHTIALFSQTIAIGLWLLAVISHIIFFSLFCYHRLKKFELNHIVPSWFVPPIGIVVACLTVPAPAFRTLAVIILVFGLLSYLVLLPMVIYRLIVGEQVEAARRPTVAILAAPASLSLSGYLSLYSNPDPLLVMILFSIAILMTLTVYLLMFHLLRLPFTPSYSAYTFPLAISATAMFKTSVWMKGQVLFQQYSTHLARVARLEGIISSAVILYVLYRFIHYLHKECR